METILIQSTTVHVPTVISLIDTTIYPCSGMSFHYFIIISSHIGDSYLGLRTSILIIIITGTSYPEAALIPLPNHQSGTALLIQPSQLPFPQGLFNSVKLQGFPLPVLWDPV